MTDQDDQSSRDTRSEQRQSPRQRAIEAYEGARDRATDTLGAGAAARACRRDRRRRADRCPAAAHRDRNAARPPTARRVKDSARAAVEAARDTGTQRLDELGISREKGEETIRSLLDGLTDAAKASANAAVDAVRNKG